MSISLDFSDFDFTLDFADPEKPSVEWEGREIKQLEFVSSKPLPQIFHHSSKKLCHGRQVGKLVLFPRLQFVTPIVCGGLFKSLKKSASKLTSGIIETAKAVYSASMQVLKAAATVVKNTAEAVYDKAKSLGHALWEIAKESKEVFSLSDSFCQAHNIPLGAKFIATTVDKIKNAGEAIADFVKEHQTEIIIGVIVVAAVAVAFVFAYSGVATVVTEGVATVAAAGVNELNKKLEEKEDKSEKKDKSTSNPISQNNPSFDLRSPDPVTTPEFSSNLQDPSLSSDPPLSQYTSIDLDQMMLSQDQKITIVPITSQYSDIKAPVKTPTCVNPGSTIQPNEHPGFTLNEIMYSQVYPPAPVNLSPFINTHSSTTSQKSSEVADNPDGCEMPDPPPSPILDRYEQYCDQVKLDKRAQEEAEWEALLAQQKADKEAALAELKASTEAFENNTKGSRNLSEIGEGPSSLLVSGANGINTSVAEARSHQSYLQSLIPDSCVTKWSYNQTHGVFADLAEVLVCIYNGFSPNTIRTNLDNWEAFHKANIHNPNAKLIQFCHSKGAGDIYNALVQASPEIRNRVIVVAIAPAKVIPKELCFNSFNYASTRDIVHYGELFHAGLLDTHDFRTSVPMNMAQEHREQLIMLEPHPEATGIDHDFQSPTFRKVIEDRLNDYIRMNGEFNEK
ncbi:MAG: hypothetical protein JSS32_10130 [Verrucomicrobia bacterium]|nr:hypothetical protein [Verrucomicrobiota bacterium]